MKGGQSLRAKDEFNNLFYVLETIFFDKSEHIWGAQLAQEIRKVTRSLGDYQLLNDALFENYSNCCTYFDDNMERTSFFLDLLSSCDLQQKFVFKNQAQQMAYEFQHLPSVMFKKYCANQQRYINNKPVRVQYPKVFRDIWAETKKNQAIFD